MSDAAADPTLRRKSKRMKTNIDRKKKDPEGFLSYKPRVPDVTYTDTVSPEFLQSLSGQERARQSVIFELINTEQLYFRDLRILTDAFLRPIRERNVLTEEECKYLFGNLDEVVSASEKFMRDLEQLQQKDQLVEGVGTTILNHVDTLRPAFVEYCSRTSIVIDFLNKLEENNQEFSEFLTSRAQKPIFRSLKLGSFLAAPNNRLFKYPLLLSEIRKATPAGHADSLTLEVAHEKIKEILAETNKQAEKVDEAFKLEQFRKKMDKKYTELLEQCELQLDEEVTVETDTSTFTTHMILLDQYLLYTKFKRDNIKVKRKVDLDTMQVCDDPDEKQLEISVAISGVAAQFIFKNVELKTKWKERLQALQTKHLEALVRKKAIRIQRSKKPLQPQEIDPEDELGLLEHENQLLANQLHAIALKAGGQMPTTTSAVYVPVGEKSKPKKKHKPRSRILDDQKCSSLPTLETTPSVLDLFDKLNRRNRDYSLPQMVVIFQGPRYSGKTTIIRKLMGICAKDHQLRCAYLEEKKHCSIFNPFPESKSEVTLNNLVPTLVHGSVMMGNIVESMLGLEHVDFYYDIIFIDGEFRFESQLTGFLKALEGSDVQTLICNVTAAPNTLKARKPSSRKKQTPEIELPPRDYPLIKSNVTHVCSVNTSQPEAKCVTYVLQKMLNLLKQ